METSTIPFDLYNYSVGTDITPNAEENGLNFSTVSSADYGDGVLDNSTGNTSLYYYYDGNYYYGDDYYDDDYYDYYLFQIYTFEVYALGFVQPFLVLLATLSNVFVAVFFLMKKNRRKATNVLFVSIAISDTMTGVMLLPNAFGVYARNLEDMSREWCNTYMVLRFYVSPVFHTVSVWQTVVLSIQRYMCVCHPFISGRICTFWKTFVSIIIMYCMAIVLHVYHLVDNKLGHVRCRWQTETPCKESCVYLWFSVVLQHLLPCILLVTLTVITIKELGKAQRRVSTMSQKRSPRRSNREKIITYTAVLVVIFFLIPEFPHGIYKLVFVIFKHVGNYNRISVLNNHIIISVYELALTVSFCANFWIYCCMMRDFRRKVLELLTCGAFKRGFSRLRSLSASSKGGSIRTTLSRSSSNASRNRVFSRTTSLHSTASENVHAVIPLTTTTTTPRGRDNMNLQEQTTLRIKYDDVNDDVFED